ncbi:MAG: radical SAM protein [Oligoflexia bacterium]|nr:radical SAM protein [Oligoflexia bacterium]
MTATLVSEMQVLKETRSRCPVCFALCPAQVLKSNGTPSQVVLARECSAHGRQESVISSDARFYWLSHGSRNGACQETCACAAGAPDKLAALGRNALLPHSTPFEKLSTCLALIEIVDSCNLSCPTCYADSPHLPGSVVKAVPVADLIARIQGVIDRKGGIEILQLSGGEPTLHPDFFRLLDWIKTNPKIDYLLINTNGLRLANDEQFITSLAERVRFDNLQIYLQFDGPQEAGQRQLRGADLREIRMRAIERCASIGLPVTLAMTVTAQNIPYLWAAAKVGLEHKNVRGITYQPLILSGRNPSSLAQSANPINTADIILGLVEQAGGQLCFDDFTPLPCGDPNCATIGYLLRIQGELRSISSFVDFKRVQGFLSDRVRYSLEDLSKCGCESEPLGKLLHDFELDESNTFRLFIKPFMDARTWDEDRIDRCCTHVIRPDGKLDSFCRYYSGFSDKVAAQVE